MALWFALHQAKAVSINTHEYVYYYDSKEEYSYIILMVSDLMYCDTMCLGVSLQESEIRRLYRWP